MPGLQLNAGAQVMSRFGGFSNNPNPTTATEAAFGTAAAPADSGVSALAPNDAGGVGFWWSVFSLGVLVFLWYSLPA